MTKLNLDFCNTLWMKWGKSLSFLKIFSYALSESWNLKIKVFVHISYHNFCFDQNVKFVCKVKIDRSKLSFCFDDFHIVSAILCYWSVIVVWSCSFPNTMGLTNMQLYHAVLHVALNCNLEYGWIMHSGVYCQCFTNDRFIEV